MLNITTHTFQCCLSLQLQVNRQKYMYSLTPNKWTLCLVQTPKPGHNFSKYLVLYSLYLIPITNDSCLGLVLLFNESVRRTVHECEIKHDRTVD